MDTNLKLSAERIDELYGIYLRQRETSKRNVEKHGGEMRDTYISTKKDFVSDLKSARGDDKKSSYSDLAKMLARDEVYVTSTKKAFAAAQAHALSKGVPLSPGLVQAYRMNIEYRGETIWEDVSRRYHELRDQGLNSRTAKNIIASEYFGGS